MKKMTREKNYQEKEGREDKEWRRRTEEGTKGGDNAEKEKKRDKRKAFVFSPPSFCTPPPIAHSSR